MATNRERKGNLLHAHSRKLSPVSLQLLRSHIEAQSSVDNHIRRREVRLRGIQLNGAYAPVDAADNRIRILKVLSENVLYRLYHYQCTTLEQLQQRKSDLVHDDPAFAQEDVPYTDNHIVGEGAGVDAHEPLRAVHGRRDAQLRQVGVQFGNVLCQELVHLRMKLRTRVQLGSDSYGPSSVPD